MPAQLLSLTDGPSILLDKPILLFGRHPECDIQLNSRKVSRRHCCVAQVHDYLVVRDLGSTNGIRINGSRVLEGTLKAGDELTIGNFKYQICWDLPGGAISEPESAKRPSHRAAAPAPLRPGRVLSKPIDQLLEDADEPIPIEEDESMSQILKAKPANPRSQPLQRKTTNGTLSDNDESSIIPSELNVVPPSGANQLPR